MLELAYTPRSLTIYGAGVIGCEYASIFKGLGIKVTLINHRAKLLEALFQPFTVADRSINTGTSIGVAVSGHHAMTAEQLLKNADIAMYQAKSQGRGQVTLHHAALNWDGKAVAKFSLPTTVRPALVSTWAAASFAPNNSLNTFS